MQPRIALKNPGPRALSACASTVAENYRNEIQVHRQPTGLPLAWRGLLKDLRSRCPGFTEIQYGIALNQAFIGADETQSHSPTPFPAASHQDAD